MGVRELPHRVTDEHLVSEIGGLYAHRAISLAEYEAGIRYGTIILDYLKTIDAPGPYSSERCDSLADDVCLGRKLAMAAARQVLKDLNDSDCMKVVDRVTIYGEPIYGDDLQLLRKGLLALAGD